MKKTDNCWLWTASLRGKTGYGAFRYKGKTYDTHRFVWFLEHGTFPKELVLHKCDNKKCVNPNHLYLGSHKDNTRDSMEAGSHHLPSPVRKYSQDLIEEIRSKYVKGVYGCKKLSKEFGIDHSYIARIVKKNKLLFLVRNEGGL